MGNSFEPQKFTRETLIDICGGNPDVSSHTGIGVRVRVLACMVWHLDKRLEELEAEVKRLLEAKSGGQ